MPGPQKRRTIAREPISPETDESDEDNSMDQEEQEEGQDASDVDGDGDYGQEEIQTDFEGRNPEGEDFHGIKQLLQQLFLKAHIDLSQLTDLIIAQAGLGSVLKQCLLDGDDEDDDDDMSAPLDVFGVTTVINTSVHKEKSCIQQITQLIQELSEQYSNIETQNTVKNILSKSRSVGLLINERFVNIPAKISDPLLSTLRLEIEKFQARDPRYAFEYLIMICKVHKPKGDRETTTYVNYEEEIFAKHATASFEFSVAAESDTSVSGKWSDGDVEMLPYREILFIDAKKLGTIVEQIKVFLS